VILAEDLCENKRENSDSAAVNWQKIWDTLPIDW